MQTKDYVYLGFIVLTAAVFYWHGFLAARARARKSFAAIFKDARSLMEVPGKDDNNGGMAIHNRLLRPRDPRGGTRIRAVFGVN